MPFMSEEFHISPAVQGVIVAVAAAVAILCAGANGLIGFFAGQGPTIFA